MLELELVSNQAWLQVHREVKGRRTLSVCGVPDKPHFWFSEALRCWKCYTPDGFAGMGPTREQAEIEAYLWREHATEVSHA
jgi:hypothetical protein